MKRYHKKVYFPENNGLKEFNNTLNALNWKYSTHCLENLKHRVIDVEDLLLYVKDLSLKFEDIFEYYEDKIIEKACYRIHYKGSIDIILVVNQIKSIITIYINDSEDKHYTLKKELYQREVG